MKVFSKLKDNTLLLLGYEGTYPKRLIFRELKYFHEKRVDIDL